MVGRFTRWLVGNQDWSEYVFRTPPKHPDARDIYLGGCGLITMVRGLFYLYGTPPQAALFTALGDGFVVAWSWIWIWVGIAVLAVTFTKHKWPEADRLAAFAVMMVWWVWGFIYLISGMLFYDSGRSVTDLLNALILFITGVVLSAGVIQGVRKTQEIALREVAVKRIRQMELEQAELIGENERLRKKCGET